MLQSSRSRTYKLSICGAKLAGWNEEGRGGRKGQMDMMTLPAMILRMGSTMDRSSTVPVATAGSKGV